MSGAFEAFAWANTQVAERRRPDQPLIRLMDGQKSLWEAADGCLQSVPAGKTGDILNILHVSQYVWRAAGVFYGAFDWMSYFQLVNDYPVATKC